MSWQRRPIPTLRDIVLVFLETNYILFRICRYKVLLGLSFHLGRHMTEPASSLVATGNLDKAAIFNAEGNSVWASSPGFTVRSYQHIAITQIDLCFI